MAANYSVLACHAQVRAGTWAGSKALLTTLLVNYRAAGTQLIKIVCWADCGNVAGWWRGASRLQAGSAGSQGGMKASERRERQNGPAENSGLLPASGQL